MSSGKVRPATAADMKYIESWLPTDYSIGTLAMNWKTTIKMFKEGAVSVWEDATIGQPVAYCWGALNSRDSVLEVHPNYRKTGIGRKMAEFMIEAAITAGDPLLEIEIAPESAENFWKRMRFQTYWQKNSCFGRRILQLEQPRADGIRRSVTVEFLPASASWSNDPAIKALATHNIIGTETSEGKIILEKSVAHFDLEDGADLVMEVKVDGQSLYRGKAKHEGAKAIGVKGGRCGFMIREIIPVSES